MRATRKLGKTVRESLYIDEGPDSFKFLQLVNANLPARVQAAHLAARSGSEPPLEAFRRVRLDGLQLSRPQASGIVTLALNDEAP